MPGSQEADIRRTIFQVNLYKKHKALPEKQQIRKGLAQIVECLLSKPKALSLILTTTNKRNMSQNSLPNILVV
jgi:hypothetical protein